VLDLWSSSIDDLAAAGRRLASVEWSLPIVRRILASSGADH
jgi:hypothetical protein